MMHELEQLRELKQINMREIDSLRSEVGEGRRANLDLKQQIDLKIGDFSQRQRQLFVGQEENKNLREENE